MQPAEITEGDREEAGDVSFDAIAEVAAERLGKNQPLRRNLPGNGRLRIDRQLPFLCLYRTPDARDAGTRELVTTEAAYLFASGEEQYRAGLSNLCRQIGALMEEHFGRFLFIEVWAEEPDDSLDDDDADVPAFEIVMSEPEALPSMIDSFGKALSEIAIRGRPAQVSVSKRRSIGPPGMRPLEDACSDGGGGGCCRLGIAVRPIYRDPQSQRLYPVVLQQLRGQLAGAMRKAVAEFTGMQSGQTQVHYESLGPSTLVQAARTVDEELCELSESFDFLLQVTPTNAEQAWEEFAAGGCREAPHLFYRPLPYHPSLLKRRLFEIEIERIEDPALAHLYWEKQEELDLQLTALRNLDSPDFLHNSLQIYGDADDELVNLAHDILDGTPVSNAEPWRQTVSADEFARRAQQEIDLYRSRLDQFDASVEVCDHIAAGIMVSRDRLLVARDLQMRSDRVEPLLHHEVGTHLLTYFNGRCQRFRQLSTGLAGYDELQEGLAVLAEYLCGGLTAARMRLLAGRVISVRSMTDGKSFAETYALLHEEFQFSPRQAFICTLRVFRGGGLTKDMIYLRGLRDLLGYISNGHDIEPLYVGKLGLQHLPYVQEMRRRGVIDAPRILPRLFDADGFRGRLDRCRNLSPHQLLDNRP